MKTLQELRELIKEENFIHEVAFPEVDEIENIIKLEGLKLSILDMVKHTLKFIRAHTDKFKPGGSVHYEHRINKNNFFFDLIYTVKIKKEVFFYKFQYKYISQKRDVAFSYTTNHTASKETIITSNTATKEIYTTFLQEITKVSESYRNNSKEITNNINTNKNNLEKNKIPEIKVEPKINTDEIIKKVKSHLENFKMYFSRSGDWEKGGIRIEKYNNKTELATGIRDWGIWSNADWDNSEDSDNQELRPAYYEKAVNSFNNYMKNLNIDKKYIKNINVYTGEKNWLYFEVILNF